MFGLLSGAASPQAFKPPNSNTATLITHRLIELSVFTILPQNFTYRRLSIKTDPWLLLVRDEQAVLDEPAREAFSDPMAGSQN